MSRRLHAVVGPSAQGWILGTRLYLRSLGTWVAAVAGVALLLTPLLFSTAPDGRGWNLAPELLISTTWLWGWCAGLIVMPELAILTSESAGPPSAAGFISRKRLDLGASLGGAAGILVVSLGFAAALAVANPLGPIGVGELLLSGLVAWTGAWSLWTWMLLLRRAIPSNAVAAVALALLLGSLSPSLLHELPLGSWLRALFFPVSPQWFSSDEWVRGMNRWRVLSASALYVTALHVALLAPTRRQDGPTVSA